MFILLKTFFLFSRKKARIKTNVSPKRNHNLDATEIVTELFSLKPDMINNVTNIPSLMPRPPGIKAINPSVAANAKENPVIRQTGS